MNVAAQTQTNVGPKRHHYVPRMMQKRFVNEKGRLHYVRRECPDKVLEVGPDQLFVENHLYAIINKNNSKDLALEKYYSELESNLDSIFQQICDAAQPANRLEFEPGVKKVIAEFIYNQLRRCPDYHRRIASDLAVRGVLRESVVKLAAEFPAKAAEIERLLDEKHLPRLIRNVRVGALSLRPSKVLSVFQKMSVCVLSIKNPKKSFVLGSIPVVKMGSDALEHKNCEIWMPISAKVAVGFIWKTLRYDCVIGVDAEDIRRLNLAIARQSSALASASPELVKSLIRPA